MEQVHDTGLIRELFEEGFEPVGVITHVKEEKDVDKDGDNIAVEVWFGPDIQWRHDNVTVIDGTKPEKGDLYSFKPDTEDREGERYPFASRVNR